MYRAIGFLSFFDRFSAAPMMVVFASQEGAPLATAAALLAGYSFAYALGQPLWGALGDRVGRIFALRLALCGSLVASVLSVVLDPMPLVFAARILAGIFVGGLFPTIMTITGDTVREGPERSREVSALQTTTALGTTAATVLAAAVASLASWRVVPAVAAAGFALTLWAVRPLHESARRATLTASRAAFSRWTLVLYVIGVLDGAVLLGVFSFIAPAITAGGVAPALAGIFTASYGIAIIVGAQINRRLIQLWPRTRTMFLGGIALVLAYALAATGATPALAAASALIGLSNAFFHAAVQTWATEVAPQARATTVSLFVFALFAGAALATSTIAPMAEHGYGTVFLISTFAAVVLTGGATWAYSFWERERSTPQTMHSDTPK